MEGPSLKEQKATAEREKDATISRVDELVKEESLIQKQVKQTKDTESQKRLLARLTVIRSEKSDLRGKRQDLRKKIKLLDACIAETQKQRVAQDLPSEGTPTLLDEDEESDDESQAGGNEGQESGSDEEIDDEELAEREQAKETQKVDDELKSLKLARSLEAEGEAEVKEEGKPATRDPSGAAESAPQPAQDSGRKLQRKATEVLTTQKAAGSLFAGYSAGYDSTSFDTQRNEYERKKKALSEKITKETQQK